MTTTTLSDQALKKEESAHSLPLAQRLVSKFRLLPVLVSLTLVWTFFAFQSPVFLSARNLNFLLLQISVLAMMALALTFTLLIAEIDLSIGAVSAFSAAVAGYLMVQSDQPAWLGVLVGLGVAAIIGALNGFVVNLFEVPSFIVTLGMMLALQGGLLFVLPENSKLISLSGESFTKLTTSYLSTLQAAAVFAFILVLLMAPRLGAVVQSRRYGARLSVVKMVVAPLFLASAGFAAVMSFLASYRGLPLMFAIVLVLFAISSYFLSYTATGRHMYALGGSAEASRRVGIPVKRVRLLAFVLTAVGAAAAGMLAASRVLAVSFQSANTSTLLEAVAAAIIGGVSLGGGRGSIWAALLGAFVMGSITNGLFLIGADERVRLIVQGTILVLALVVDAQLTKAERRQLR